MAAVDFAVTVVAVVVAKTVVVESKAAVSFQGQGISLPPEPVTERK